MESKVRSWMRREWRPVGGVKVSGVVLMEAAPRKIWAVVLLVGTMRSVRPSWLRSARASAPGVPGSGRVVAAPEAWRT